MQGQVIRIHSDFYYVEDEKHNILTCKIREILKKQKTDIVVGDRVELSDDLKFILKRLERKNSLLRPKASNVDIALVVTSFKEPELDFVQLNRYLIYLKYCNIKTAICINKEDLIENNQDKMNDILKIYSSLDYDIFFISAKHNIGIDNLKKYIKNKLVVLCGPSGVGKTTLVNTLIPQFSAKTNNVSQKTLKGRHTTRHCEIIEYNDYKIMDTPGFSCLKFDFLLPDELLNLFDDIKKYGKNCKYKNCLHNTESNGACSVKDNLDKIDNTRYQSYIEFLKESLEFKQKISKKSIKKEDSLKLSGNKIYTKISKNKRDISRKVLKQKIGADDAEI